MRKTCTSEFKKRVVLEILKEEKTIAEITSDYEVHPTHNWLKKNPALNSTWERRLALISPCDPELALSTQAELLSLKAKRDGI